jgi:hypothetical protein
VPVLSREAFLVSHMGHTVPCPKWFSMCVYARFFSCRRVIYEDFLSLLSLSSGRHLKPLGRHYRGDLGQWVEGLFLSQIIVMAARHYAWDDSGACPAARNGAVVLTGSSCASGRPLVHLSHVACCQCPLWLQRRGGE